MRFIHTADLHLDSKIDSLPLEKSRIRKEEVVRGFERLAEYATANDVKAVIIAGDMFDTSRVSQKIKTRILQAIISNDIVDFLYLSGNHDDDCFIKEVEELPKNLKIFGNEWTSFVYDDVVITGRNIVGADMKMVYDTLSLNADKVNIVALHGQVVGYKSTEHTETISIPSLREKNIDYLALGHIHAYSEGNIDNRGKYIYSGCLEGRGFDELGSKGFVLIDIQEKKVNHSYIDFSCRNFYEYFFNVSEKENWYTAREEIISDVRNKFDKTSLLKVILCGDRGANFDIDQLSLTSILNEYFFFAKVYDKTTIKIDINEYEHDKSVKGEFVRAVWESDFSDDIKGKIILCGLNVLKGEDV